MCGDWVHSVQFSSVQFGYRSLLISIILVDQCPSYPLCAILRLTTGSFIMISSHKRMVNLTWSLTFHIFCGLRAGLIFCGLANLKFQSNFFLAYASIAGWRDWINQSHRLIHVVVGDFRAICQVASRGVYEDWETDCEGKEHNQKMSTTEDSVMKRERTRFQKLCRTCTEKSFAAGITTWLKRPFEGQKSPKKVS